MSFEWVETTLGEVCAAQNGAIQTGPFGSQLHASDYVETGIPVVMPSNIGPDGGISEDGIARIKQEDADRLSQHKLQIGDVVFSRRGDVTRNALIEPHQVGWLCGTGCLKVRLGDERKADAKFISYCLRLPETKEWLIRHAVGATMPNLNTAILSAVPIQIPPISEQKKITNLLRALDDRIALLRDTNTTLEAIAQALFKSWFVDFDPVHANAAFLENGQAPSLPAEIQALFPSRLVESPQGLIPEGWEVGTVEDVIDTVGGATPNTKNDEFWNPPEISWTSPKDLSGLNTPALLETDRKISKLGLAKISSGLLPVGTLLMSSRAPIGYLAIAQVPLAINQGYIAMPPGGKLPPLFMLYWCRQNMEVIKNRANGSTFMEISKKAFRPIEIVLPATSVVDAFMETAVPLFERLVENEKQISSLSELRDTLLPRLISGQLRLPEAEAALAKVG